MSDIRQLAIRAENRNRALDEVMWRRTFESADAEDQEISAKASRKTDEEYISPPMRIVAWICSPICGLLARLMAKTKEFVSNDKLRGRDPWELTEEERNAEGERLRARREQADREAAPLMSLQLLEAEAEETGDPELKKAAEAFANLWELPPE